MNSLRIGFDLSQVAHHGGVATYTNKLAKQLADENKLEMVYFYTSLRKPYAGDLKSVKSFPIPPTIAEVLFNNIHKVPIEIFIGKIDIFHSSDWLQPPTKAKKVTTYHDVIPLKYPQWSHPKIVKVHKRRMEIVEKEIDMVIAVSESTKKDLIKCSKIPAEKITVIYEAAGDEFKPQDVVNIEKFRAKYKLPEHFILAIGGVGERRNMNRVKEAAGEHPVIITGQTIPYLPYNEMPLLYAAAELLLYPSLYEGFGLPILEAMGCGTPVITSNVSSMPEIGGDAAIYVDPLKSDEMKKKVIEVMEDKNLKKEMIKKGHIQNNKFSWEKCGWETFELYKRLLGK